MEIANKIQKDVCEKIRKYTWQVQEANDCTVVYQDLPCTGLSVTLSMEDDKYFSVIPAVLNTAALLADSQTGVGVEATQRDVDFIRILILDCVLQCLDHTSSESKTLDETVIKSYILNVSRFRTLERWVDAPSRSGKEQMNFLPDPQAPVKNCAEIDLGKHMKSSTKTDLTQPSTRRRDRVSDKNVGSDHETDDFMDCGKNPVGTDQEGDFCGTACSDSLVEKSASRTAVPEHESGAEKRRNCQDALVGQSKRKKARQESCIKRLSVSQELGQMSSNRSRRSAESQTPCRNKQSRTATSSASSFSKEHHPVSDSLMNYKGEKWLDYVGKKFPALSERHVMKLADAFTDEIERMRNARRGNKFTAFIKKTERTSEKGNNPAVVHRKSIPSGVARELSEASPLPVRRKQGSSQKSKTRQTRSNTSWTTGRLDTDGDRDVVISSPEKVMTMTSEYTLKRLSVSIPRLRIARDNTMPQSMTVNSHDGNVAGQYGVNRDKQVKGKDKATPSVSHAVKVGTVEAVINANNRDISAAENVEEIDKTLDSRQAQVNAAKCPGIEASVLGTRNKNVAGPMSDSNTCGTVPKTKALSLFKEPNSRRERVRFRKFCGLIDAIMVNSPMEQILTGSLAKSGMPLGEMEDLHTGPGDQQTGATHSVQDSSYGSDMFDTFLDNVSPAAMERACRVPLVEDKSGNAVYKECRVTLVDIYKCIGSAEDVNENIAVKNIDACKNLTDESLLLADPSPDVQVTPSKGSLSQLQRIVGQLEKCESVEIKLPPNKEAVVDTSKSDQTSSVHVSVRPSNDDTGVVQFKEKSDVVKSKDDAGIGQGKDDGVVVQSKDNACVVQSKDNACVVQSKDNAGVVQSKDNAGVVQSKDNAGVVQSKGNGGVVQSEDDADVMRPTNNGVGSSRGDNGVGSSRGDNGVILKDNSVVVSKHDSAVMQSTKNACVEIVDKLPVKTSDAVSKSTVDVGVDDTQSDKDAGVDDVVGESRRVSPEILIVDSKNSRTVDSDERLSYGGTGIDRDVTQIKTQADVDMEELVPSTSDEEEDEVGTQMPLSWNPAVRKDMAITDQDSKNWADAEESIAESAQNGSKVMKEVAMCESHSKENNEEAQSVVILDKDSEHSSVCIISRSGSVDNDLSLSVDDKDDTSCPGGGPLKRLDVAQKANRSLSVEIIEKGVMGGSGALVSSGSASAENIDRSLSVEIIDKASGCGSSNVQSSWSGVAEKSESGTSTQPPSGSVTNSSSENHSQPNNARAIPDLKRGHQATSYVRQFFAFVHKKPNPFSGVNFGYSPLSSSTQKEDVFIKESIVDISTLELPSQIVPDSQQGRISHILETQNQSGGSSSLFSSASGASCPILGAGGEIRDAEEEGDKLMDASGDKTTDAGTESGNTQSSLKSDQINSVARRYTDTHIDDVNEVTRLGRLSHPGSNQNFVDEVNSVESFVCAGFTGIAEEDHGLDDSLELASAGQEVCPGLSGIAEEGNLMGDCKEFPSTSQDADVSGQSEDSSPKEPRLCRRSALGQSCSQDADIESDNETQVSPQKQKSRTAPVSSGVVGTSSLKRPRLRPRKSQLDSNYPVAAVSVKAVGPPSPKILRGRRRRTWAPEKTHSRVIRPKKPQISPSPKRPVGRPRNTQKPLTCRALLKIKEQHNKLRAKSPEHSQGHIAAGNVSENERKISRVQGNQSPFSDEDIFAPHPSPRKMVCLESQGFTVDVEELRLNEYSRSSVGKMCDRALAGPESKDQDVGNNNEIGESQGFEVDFGQDSNGMDGSGNGIAGIHASQGFDVNFHDHSL